MIFSLHVSTSPSRRAEQLLQRGLKTFGINVINELLIIQLYFFGLIFSFLNKIELGNFPTWERCFCRAVILRNSFLLRQFDSFWEMIFTLCFKPMYIISYCFSDIFFYWQRDTPATARLGVNPTSTSTDLFIGQRTSIIYCFLFEKLVCL